MNKGLTVLKWVLFVFQLVQKNPKFIYPSQIVWDFNEKRLHWASVVRVLDEGRKDTFLVELVSTGTLRVSVIIKVARLILCLTRLSNFDTKERGEFLIRIMVEIGLTDVTKSGGVMAPQHPQGRQACITQLKFQKFL